MGDVHQRLRQLFRREKVLDMEALAAKLEGSCCVARPMSPLVALSMSQ
jgi:hypothetical protein